MDNRLTILLRAYLIQTLNAAEEEELATLIAASDDETLDSALTAIWTDYPERHPLPASEATAMLARILPQQARVTRLRMIRRWSAAAAILLVATSIFLYTITRHRSVPAAPVAQRDIPAPKGSRTTLTLASGQQFLLDSMRTGTLAQQGASTVAKHDSLALTYEANAATTTSAILYNTLTTARGGQTRVMLADGTQVWLNTASSLRFPTAFPGGDRTVELTGEAYFEVAPRRAQPFIVTVSGSRVEVLGTHFDIMAYPDEQEQRTTLLEGAVRVDRGSQALTLKPGQQAALENANGNLAIRRDIDEESVLAWKNGNFDFDHVDIQSMMRQISRWYNVTVVYAGVVPTGHFSGIVSRTSNISDVLKIFDQAKIRYSISGDRITIEGTASPPGH